MTALTVGSIILSPASVSATEMISMDTAVRGMLSDAALESDNNEIKLRTTTPDSSLAEVKETNEGTTDVEEEAGITDPQKEDISDSTSDNDTNSDTTSTSADSESNDPDPTGTEDDLKADEGEKEPDAPADPSTAPTEEPEKIPTAIPEGAGETEETEITPTNVPGEEDPSSAHTEEPEPSATLTPTPTESIIETAEMEKVTEARKPTTVIPPVLPATTEVPSQETDFSEDAGQSYYPSETYIPWTSYSTIIPPATINRNTYSVGFVYKADAKKMTISDDRLSGDQLDVREEPNDDSRIIGILSRGALFYDIDTDNDQDYCYIEAVDSAGNIVRGYVSRKNIREISKDEDADFDDAGKYVKRIIAESYNRAFWDNNQTTQSHLLKIRSESTALRNEIIKYAEQFLGNPYVWGGEDLVNGCDCSGYTRGIYRHFGIELPRCSYEQAEVGNKISLSALKPGDLVFYARDGVVYHVMLYHGDGQVIHASSSTTGIIISNLNTDRFCWGVRILDDGVKNTNYISSGSTQASEIVSNGRLAYMGDTEAQEKVIEQLAEASISAEQETGFKRSVLIAQAILESGWVSFTNPVDGGIKAEDNNILGMNSDLNGHPMTYAKGSVDRIVPQWNGNEDVWGIEAMRCYSSLEDCFKDFASFRMWMHPELDSLKDDYEAYLHLAVLGYATDPSYEENLASIIKKYDLRKYDDANETVLDEIDMDKLVSDAESAASGNEESRQAVINTVSEAANAGWEEYGVAPSLLTAMAVNINFNIDTEVLTESNNLFVVPADDTWTGDVVETQAQITVEKAEDEEKVELKKYDTLTEACTDYAAELADQYPDIVGLVDPEKLAAMVGGEESEKINETYEKYNLGKLDTDPMFRSETGIEAVDNTAYTQDELELIWAIVAQEDDQSYEGALAVISSAMNRADANYGGYGRTALSQLTADGQYCYSPKVSDPSLWERRLGGNVPEDVKRAVEDCLTKGIRNNAYLNFRSTNRTGSYVKIGANWYF